MSNPVTENDVVELFKSKMFIRNITDIKNEAGEQLVSPIQDLIDQRIRDLIPGVCLQSSFEPNYQAMRTAAFYQENNIAKNSLTIIGLKIIDKERNAR